VNIAALARSFALLRLPKMPELKQIKVEFKETKVEGEIQYKNTKRVIHDSKPAPKKAKTIPWSNQKEMKQKKQERQVKRERRKLAIAKSKTQSTNS
jgi:ATP-dependent RNA helicase DDX55/SPB4